MLELSEMIAIAFLAGCGVLMAWRQTARTAKSAPDAHAPPSVPGPW